MLDIASRHAATFYTMQKQVEDAIAQRSEQTSAELAANMARVTKKYADELAKFDHVMSMNGTRNMN